MIAALVFLSSCGKKAPKCDNGKVIEIVKSLIFPILEENDYKLAAAVTNMDGRIVNKDDPNFENARADAIKGDDEYRQKQKLQMQEAELKNIITTEVNEELKSCGCEATLSMKGSSEIAFGTVVKFLGNGSRILYNVKTDSNGEVVVEVMPN